MVEHGDTKILFDPFFHNAYDTYQLVPDSIRNALFSGLSPYDNIDAIFISHAHGDHFDANDLVRFLQSSPKTILIAPQQAIDQLDVPTDDKNEWANNVISIKLEYQDAPVSRRFEDYNFSAVRIPHAGWPNRAEISNLVYRVTLKGSVTVVHMGDADPDDEHFAPLMKHWNQVQTDIAFPPYWFFISRDGPAILKQRVQATENIGVHVPVDVPKDLQLSGAKYFSSPGETHPLNAH